MSKISLFNITHDLSSLIEEIQENGGEVTPEQSEELSIKREQLEHKVYGYDAFIKLMDSQIDLANKELDRITAFISEKKSIQDKLKENLLQALLLFGEEKKNGVRVLEVGTIKLSTRKSSSIEVENSEVLDEKFKSYDFSISNLDKEKLDKIQSIMDEESIEYKTVVKPSKTLIKVAIEAKEEVKGASQITKTSLKIS